MNVELHSAYAVGGHKSRNLERSGVYYFGHSNGDKTQM